MAYRLRVVVHGGKASPTIRQIGVSTARPGLVPEATSEPSLSEHVELNVPAYSQSIHRKEYPDFGGGGAVWCSAASTAMLLSYWGCGADCGRRRDTSARPGVRPERTGRRAGGVRRDPHLGPRLRRLRQLTVNTAYASEYGVDGSIRQYASLRDVESWVARGVPVIVSTAWDNTAEDSGRHLDGSSIEETSGHIMVVAGFTEDGDVIANDPASPSNDQVHHVYRRDQFERNWLRSSNGTTYLIKLPSIVG